MHNVLGYLQKKKKENNHRLPKSSIKLKTCAYTDTSCQTKTQLCVHVHCTRSSISHVGEMPFMESLSSSIWNIGHSCDTIDILSRRVYSQVPHIQVSEITQWRIKRHFTHMSQVFSCYFKLVIFIKSLSHFFSPLWLDHSCPAWNQQSPHIVITAHQTIGIPFIVQLSAASFKGTMIQWSPHTFSENQFGFHDINIYNYYTKKCRVHSKIITIRWILFLLNRFSSCWEMKCVFLSWKNCFAINKGRIFMASGC